MPIDKTSKSPRSIESRFAWLAFFGNVIPSLLLLLALWWYGVSAYVLGIVAFFLAFLALYTVITVWKKAEYQFRSLHNLLEALVEGNYSFRGMVPGKSGALAELVATINALAHTLQNQKLQTEESLLLLKKVVDQIDVAIIAWDQHENIRLINPAALRLLGREEEGVKGGRELGGGSGGELLGALSRVKTMAIGETEVLSLEFGHARGRFRVHMEEFIAEGTRHRLLFLTDVSNILRREEHKAWLNLIRVLSHEINNSLAPLASLSTSLKRQVARREQDAALAEELMEGMTIIGKRAESLAGFVQRYHAISKLPEPRKAPAELKQVLERLARLFPREDIRLDGPVLHLPLDTPQFEQALINLLKNAIEAGGSSLNAGQDGAAVCVRWREDEGKAVILILDRGEGIADPQNLFTPFYSTKPGGSGIGLVLSQRIIEAHAGCLSLTNREDGPGCIAMIEMPLEQPAREKIPDPA